MTLFSQYLCLSVLSGMLLPSLVLAETLNPHTDPENRGAWVLVESVSDEFDGTAVDTQKWYIQGAEGHYENRFVGRAPSQFVPDNVSVEEGCLKITTRWQPDFDFSEKVKDGVNYENITTGAVISKATFQYGYMETRSKAAKGPISSSFWTTGKGGELDVFEHWGDVARRPESAKRYHTSFHDWRVPRRETYSKRIWTNTHQLSSPVTDDFHIYALEWDPDYIKIYIDGRMIRHATREEIGDAWVVDQAQKVWLDCEVFPWEVNAKLLSASDYPGDDVVFVTDYVRIWQRSAHSVRVPDVPSENLIANPDFDAGATGWKLEAASVVADGIDGTAAIALEHRGRIEQTISLKPDTLYILSAWCKLPGTNMKDVWHNAYLGVSGHSGGTVKVKYFHNTYFRRSLEFRTAHDVTEVTIFFETGGPGATALVDAFELYEAQ
ncbi:MULTISPECIES: family 16 glycosylhydrolase [unclassified Lentimonas]|uniref:family 16 glycosylhydrolase n=1 Tax=unclassified Lentimonas TaxID=2630993 RepID=UPI00132CB9CF|nr:MULTISPECIES: family 16 glycosylhydrolase [unclassified Lentimonas]CAA6690703.1 Unannotated [Lentimonas sp. CC19]CAA6693355.1 Unannotated [Lentimonas sp. CC10]CAA7071833.1 Unannotated [Lentimonas sp. CC11]